MTVLPKLRLCWGNNPAYDPNEVASLQIPVGRLRALPQSSRGEAWEGKRRIICPQPGRVCKMVKKGCSHRCLEGTLWQLCNQPWGGLERVSAPAFDKFDATVETTIENLLTGFKRVICKKVIILLLVLGFSVPLQSRRKNSLLLSGVYFLPPVSLPVSTHLSQCFGTHWFPIHCLPPWRTLISLMRWLSFCHSQQECLRCISNAIARKGKPPQCCFVPFAGRGRSQQGGHAIAARRWMDNAPQLALPNLHLFLQWAIIALVVITGQKKFPEHLKPVYFWKRTVKHTV